MPYPRIVAIDTESVGVGPRKRSAVAQVSMVDNRGRCYNAYIKRYGVTDYRTEFSGITKHKMFSKGRKFEDVKQGALDFLDDDDDVILVGHSIHHDLRGLGIAPTFEIRDTSTFWKFKKANKGKTPGLAFLAKRFLNKELRKNGQHDCLEDAKTTLELYFLVANEWEANIRNSRRRQQSYEFDSDWSEVEPEDFGSFEF